MEIETNANDVDEHLLCCLCNELVHGPLVFSCGHFSCQWCFYSDFLKGCEGTICPICSSPVTHAYNMSRSFDSLVETHYPTLYGTREKAFGDPYTDEEVAVWRLEDQNCILCKKLVYEPTIPCCGCLYCGRCVQIPEDGTFKCVGCGILLHDWVPKVCYGLHNFLEKHFAEYGKSLNSPETAIAPKDAWWNPINLVHYGATCCCCLTSPLKGDCYKCVSCKSDGAVICLRCYELFPLPPICENPEKDTQEHRFDVVPPVSHRVQILQKAEEKAVAGIKPIVHVMGWVDDGYIFIYNGDGGSKEEQIQVLKDG